MNKPTWGSNKKDIETQTHTGLLFKKKQNWSIDSGESRTPEQTRAVSYKDHEMVEMGFSNLATAPQVETLVSSSLWFQYLNSIYLNRSVSLYIAWKWGNSKTKLSKQHPSLSHKAAIRIHIASNFRELSCEMAKSSGGSSLVFETGLIPALFSLSLWVPPTTYLLGSPSSVAQLATSRETPWDFTLGVEDLSFLVPDWDDIDFLWVCDFVCLFCFEFELRMEIWLLDVTCRDFLGVRDSMLF